MKARDYIDQPTRPRRVMSLAKPSKRDRQIESLQSSLNAMLWREAVAKDEASWVPVLASIASAIAYGLLLLSWALS